MCRFEIVGVIILTLRDLRNLIKSRKARNKR